MQNAQVSCFVHFTLLYQYIHRTRNKGTLVFFQEFGVALQEEWQQIPRTEIRLISPVCPTGVTVHGFAARGGYIGHPIFCLLDLNIYVPSNSFSLMPGRVILEPVLSRD